MHAVIRLRRDPFVYWIYCHQNDMHAACGMIHLFQSMCSMAVWRMCVSFDFASNVTNLWITLNKIMGNKTKIVCCRQKVLIIIYTAYHVVWMIQMLTLCHPHAPRSIVSFWIWTIKSNMIKSVFALSNMLYWHY